MEILFAQFMQHEKWHNGPKHKHQVYNIIINEEFLA